MLRCLPLLLIFTTLVSAADSAAAATRLATLPVTIYPDFDVAGTDFLPLFRRITRPADALVVSWRDAFKGGFRASQLDVTGRDIWVHVARPERLGQDRRRNLAGVAAAAFIPDDRGGSGYFRPAAEAFADEARGVGLVPVTGLGARDLGDLGTVADLARVATVFTFYASREQAQGGEAFRRRVERVAQAAREANPAIKLEVAVATCATPEATQRTLALLAGVAELVDRVGIFCNHTPESAQSLEALLAGLRAKVKTSS